MQGHQMIHEGAEFMPYGHCYLWEPFILWTHAISNSIIALAYFAIPICLVYIFLKRNDFQYIWLLVLFAIFILGCGTSHLMDVINIWHPYYRLDAIIRTITALASIGTALVLIHVAPQLLELPSIEKWKAFSHQLKSENENLEQEVARRTKELQESNASMKFLTDTIPQIVWTANAEGNLDYYNQNWYDYTQLSEDESIAYGWVSVIHPDDKEQLQKIWSTSVETASNFQAEFRMRDGRDGSYRWHLGRAQAMKDEEGKVSKWFGTATDIHDQKEKNEELKRVNEDLDNFIYTASHDLKAPISNLEGLMQLIEQRTPKDCEAALNPLHQMVNTQVDKLKLVISDLADVGQIKRDVVEDFETVRINKLVEEFLASNQSRFSNKQIDVKLSLKSDAVFFSSKHLRIILYNLLDNAIKYSQQAPSQIEIITDTEYDQWVLKIKDNGIGIKAENQHKIFEMFKRFNRKTDGTGMGLYIVKTTVEKYHGSVQVESEPGKGSTFSVHLPSSLLLR
ncbi:PAS domain-containing sensor histidine kinase [Porifericola rhodea]|uniref:sensor histidine kinase n=1 Tax=Porifericola rhodea TaxID=930972 RepID=UPI002666FD6B|nr:PAS domain-containing sensor histidine kinase [Porifericola rhodea]WKN31232.1 PAS domain-containing sensor histidine kinase [Porifericola rhodea]